MSSYKCFARFYDELTENAEYVKRSDYIYDFLNQEGIASGVILDLACGTCSVSLELAKKGYRIIGLDLSENMLAIASEKLSDNGCDFSLVKGNMTDFSLDKKVDSVICSLDSINHLNSLSDVERAFSCVYNSLKNGSLFIFDVNTIYKHNEILSENTFVFDEEDYYLVWDNEHIDDTSVRILIDMFIFNGETYDRESEEFVETAYETEELLTALCDVGFKCLGVYDELTHNAPKPDSQRLYFVCKKE